MLCILSYLINIIGSVIERVSVYWHKVSFTSGSSSFLLLLHHNLTSNHVFMSYFEHSFWYECGVSWPPSSGACRGRPGLRAQACIRWCPSGCRCVSCRPNAPERPPASASPGRQTLPAGPLRQTQSHVTHQPTPKASSDNCAGKSHWTLLVTCDHSCFWETHPVH